ncbi:CidA/LrgA family protein [Isachenkonia alkalipeptolytica]|uniref:CidA/LrgA family protein n=1 Tax=Isachenkonia alkalipeptolytica TaxID=2565777 RepID=A0AA44BEP0_9CLOT|nr:CidA/LrgA family protein [Isachenkonia alkalipeptolytica]NBG87746.1 CidA/LrgA family protein [Isachenkonia alkalipeptolytica]
MVVIRELLIILGILFVGEVISRGTGMPVPGNVLGLLILLGLLWGKVIKIEMIEKSTSFFLGYLAFFFLPAAVGLLGIFHLIRSQWWQITLITIGTTILVMVVTGITVQFLIRRQNRWKT